ncbi:hypothetical protein AVEN_15616-1 [Araneus ventricosus]|uniref:Uncharacterized protein n=1 Tax=Araneus ventricosus TaxID=182803 RepID=A0A4Y2GA30_ARAVE|nr:hypothetical protein AVEN_15616-1 [Araneus ventricosus]
MIGCLFYRESRSHPRFYCPLWSRLSNLANRLEYVQREKFSGTVHGRSEMTFSDEDEEIGILKRKRYSGQKVCKARMKEESFQLHNQGCLMHWANWAVAQGATDPNAPKNLPC